MRLINLISSNLSNSRFIFSGSSRTFSSLPKTKEICPIASLQEINRQKTNVPFKFLSFTATLGANFLTPICLMEFFGLDLGYIFALGLCIPLAITLCKSAIYACEALSKKGSEQDLFIQSLTPRDALKFPIYMNNLQEYLTVSEIRNLSNIYELWKSNK